MLSRTLLPSRHRSTFTPAPTALQRQLVPILTTMLGSLVTLVPIIADQPLLPPLGLMVFLGWRLLRGDIWPLWMGLPLGLWDDLNSGEAIGTAMCGWTAILLAIDLLDRRLPFRNHLQDWGIALLATIGQLTLALMLSRTSGHGETALAVLLPQFIIAFLAFPLVSRICAALDRWRSR